MLKEILNKLSCDCVVVTSTSNTMYYSGYNNPECALVADKQGIRYYTDDRYTNEARSIVPSDYEIVPVHCSNWKRICEDIMAHSPAKVALEMDYMTYNGVDSIRSLLSGVELVDCTAALCEGRVLKREDEIGYIRTAAHCNDVAFEAVLGQVREGMTELELAYLLQYEYIKAGGEGIAFDTISVFGEHTAYPHGHPGHQRLRVGDVITLDFGTKYKGYCSDITRSFAFGDPGEEYKVAYGHVLTANKMGIDAAYNGISGEELDAVSRNYLESVGLAKYFTHSLGHGVGIDIHEKPFLSTKSKDKVMKGMTFTVEPGIYINGKFGIRIEDLLYMGDHPELLRRCNKNLIIL